MRVLMVSRGVLPVGRRSGGAELAAFELARHLALQEHEVTLIADVEPTMLDGGPLGLSVRGLPQGRMSAGLTAAIPMDFPRWLVQHLVGNMRAARRAMVALAEYDAQIDVIHTHGALATVLIGRALRRSNLRIPLIYTEHDSTPWSCAPRGAIERLIRRLVYRSVNLRACHHATRVVTSFAALAQELGARTALVPEHFAVAPNGADLQRFIPPDPDIEDIDTGKRYILFVGSLIERKAPDLLLRALAHADIGLSLVVIGGGPMQHDLQRLAHRLGMADRVMFTGPQPQNVVHRYCQDAEFVVLPSVSETMPLVLIEALATGTPVVASDLDGISVIVHHGENGLLVPPRNIEALAAALRLMATDDDLFKRLASNAIPSVEVDFSWHAVAQRMSAIYAQTLSIQDEYAPVRQSGQIGRGVHQYVANPTATCSLDTPNEEQGIHV